MPEGRLDPRTLSPRARIVALLLLAAVTLCAGVGQAHFGFAQAARDVQYENLVWHRAAALIWYALAAVAVVGLCRWTAQWRLPAWRGGWRWLAVAVLLVGAAGALRVYRLAELPPGLWVDEALNGVQAVQIAQTGQPLVALPAEDVRTGVGAAYVDVAGLAFFALSIRTRRTGPLRRARRSRAAIGTVGG
jgi:hypothetical protein